MNAKTNHLTTAELMSVLYETQPGGAAGAHAAGCPECAGRLAAMRVRQGTEAAPVATRELARQRSAIYSRLDSRAAFGSRWLWTAVPVAAAAMFAFTVGLRSPEQSGRIQEVAVVEPAPAAGDTLYSDIYESLSSQAPAGVYAVSGMFEPRTDGAKAVQAEQ